MRVQRDVVYAPGLALDLYEPDSLPTALCVFLHGGGWRIGSRTEEPIPGFYEQVTGFGLAVASVDYRLSTEAVFPAQSEDVSAALRFLTPSHDRTVIWGVSAGGHLAALAALDETHRIAAAVCWYTPSDLDALSRDIDDAGGAGDRSATSRECQLIGAALDERPDLVAAASPITHVHPAAPPFLLLHGDADGAVPHRQSLRFAEALGDRATVELVPGAGHMFPELDEAAGRAVVRRSAEFLLR